MAALYFFYLALILALYIFTNHLRRKIRNLPPSPFPALPVLGHLYLFKKPLHRTLSKISARYGPVSLLQMGSRPVLIVASPSAAEECFTKNDVVFAYRPRLLAGKHIGQNYTTMLWSPYGQHWRNLRRISSIEILSSHRLQLLSSIRADEMRSFLRRLSRKPSHDQPMNMRSVLFELMLNVVMRMIAGKRYYGENLVEEMEESRRFKAIVAETFKLAGVPDIGDFLPFLRWVGVRGFEKRLIALQENRDGFMQDLIEESRRSRLQNVGGGGTDEVGEKKKTLIEVLLSLQESEPEYYTDPMIRGIMIVLLTAGTDTSSGTMEWALSLLLNNPQVLHKAQSEIDKLVGQHRLVEESDIANLPYLRCILNETMRMFPPAPVIIHESSEACSVGGFYIPRDTMLWVNLWDIQNDPNTWEEPRQFKPERFEGVEGPREGFKFMPFGSGRRSCPGEGLALKMVGIGLASLIQCFDWERISMEMVDMSEGSGLTMPKAQPLLAKCRPRPSKANLLSQLL